MNDSQLLRRYVSEDSQGAFAQLTRRYIGLVYSVSLREVENPQMAEDVTQAVFLLLAHKAPILSRRSDLAGWLFHASRLTAKNLLRRETRRVQREQAVVQNTALLKADQADTESIWAGLEPILNEALTRLAPKEREALLLRFFADMTWKEIGDVLGLTEDAARVRVSRGVERLRRRLVGRSTALSASLLGTILAAKAFHAAPAGCLSAVSELAAGISTGGSGVGGALGYELFQVMEGVWKTMWITKIKTAAVLTAVCLTVCGTTAGVIRLMAQPIGAVPSLRLNEATSMKTFRGHPVVVVDAGHGGQDTGSTGANRMTEKSLNLEIASLLRAELIRRGATVYVTRESDSLPSIRDRVAVATQRHADFFVSIHCDVGGMDALKTALGSKALETRVFYHAQKRASQRLAESIVNGVGSRLLTPVEADTVRFPYSGFGVLRPQTIPAVLIECGRMDDITDGPRLRDPLEQQRLARGITDGLISFQEGPLQSSVVPIGERQ